MGSQIPNNANFKSLSSQLGGLRFNGLVDNGTAQSISIFTVDDINAIVDNSLKTFTGKFIRIKIGNTGNDLLDFYYLPLYQ